MFEKMLEIFEKDPRLAEHKLKVKLKKTEKFRIDVKAGRHKFVLDEDKVIGGKNEGPSPAELFLSSIGGCLLSTLQVWSEILKIKVNSAEIHISGIIDIRGLLDMEGKIPAQFQKITIEVKINSSESNERIQELIQKTEMHCPVYNSLINKIETQTIIKQI
ncbi:MAG: OsmC family protein [Candidatus Helarchaeota archaeon]